ncbi:hypothetical protein JXL21_05615 [Candidatus Bathyarchaeota archaeon]|nr:hypothetical protein [Candidatus Bathyarchaeota archaeon]
MLELGAIGHVAIDRVITPGGEWTRLGGPPTYMLCLSELLDVRLKVFTCVGPDFPEEYAEWYKGRGVDLSTQVKSSPTTRFVLDYTGGGRRMSVDSVCSPVEAPVDPPDHVIVSPIIGEISNTVLESLGGVVALDPQGLVRHVQGVGRIRNKPWRNEEVLRRVAMYKSSLSELTMVTGIYEPARALKRLIDIGVEVAAVTLGGEGSLVSEGGYVHHVPAYRTKVVDETGAGDAYMVGFFAELLRTDDVEAAGAMGSACASAVVESFGSVVCIDERELRERAELVKKKIKRV